MKKLYIYMLSAISLLGILTSCNDFKDVNIDPENPSEDNMDYSYLFTQVQAQLSGSDWDIWRNGCIYTLNMMQQSSSVNWSMGVFYTYSEGYNAAAWDNYYAGRGVIRNLVDIMYHWEGNTDHAYEYQFARIMKAYIFQRVTDMYGDVPYFEAGQGYLSLNGQPKYDTQEAIYNDLLKELDEVNTALKELPVNNSEKTPISNDVLLKGDSEKWRRFGNSLMLRVAMRLSKVNPTKAKEYVTKAVANGLIQDASQDIILNRVGAVYSNDSANPFGKIISQEDSQAFYLSEYFVNTLKANNDPRLHLLGTKVTKAETKWSDEGKYDYGTSEVLDSIRGLPIGYRSSGDFTIYKAPDFPYAHEYYWPDSIPKTDWRPYYALINRYTFARPDGPSMLITYPEDCLLLADAAVHGFIGVGTATAKDYFKKGVIAAMEQYSYYGNASKLYNQFLSTTNIDTYVKQRLTAFDANPLKEINWEYYVLTFGDPYETFANWRRSGYPELKSVYTAPYSRPSYPNSVTSEIPRRFTYPIAETSVNNANYQDAVSKISGGDKISSRVWWDTK